MFINIVNIYLNKFLFLRISRNDEDLFILELFMFFVLCYLNKFDKILVDKLLIFRFYFLESIN